MHKGFSLVLDFSGQAARFGVRENDKLVTINGKTPRNVDDAVGVIKQAGNNIKLVKHNKISQQLFKASYFSTISVHYYIFWPS
jgi:hypothetical protein